MPSSDFSVMVRWGDGEMRRKGEKREVEGLRGRSRLDGTAEC